MKNILLLSVLLCFNFSLNAEGNELWREGEYIFGGNGVVDALYAA